MKEAQLKNIGVKYLKAQNKDVSENRFLIVQTGGLQLVGIVHLFDHKTKSENIRRSFLDNITNPYFFAKASGLRLYVCLHSSLSFIPQEQVMRMQEEIHNILCEMAEFYAESITDGMRRHYADEIE